MTKGTGMKRDSPWMKYYREALPEYIASPGSQLLLRLLRGRFIEDLPSGYTGCRVLDVGCGRGFNLVTCGLLGMELFGCDIAPPILGPARTVLESYHLKADLRSGGMETIPFPELEGTFDILIAWNVIHYAGNEKAVLETFTAFARMLRSGGRLWLYSTGPDSWLYKGASIEGNERIIRVGDHRKGTRTFCFRDEGHLQELLQWEFIKVRTGRTTEDLFDRVEDHYLATAVR
jgi:SAM-dependent methyltransferase